MTAPSLETGTTSGAAGSGARPSAQRTVARNALLLVASQVLGAPLSVLINAMMGRYLGPQELGRFYLATTYATFGFLLVEWGQMGVIPALVARDRSRAGQVLGSALVWRAVASPVVYGVLALGGFLLGESRAFQLALVLVCLGSMLSIVLRTCQDVIRGFERADVSAYSYLAGQALNAALIFPILTLGGRLPSVLLATAASSLIVLVPVWRALRPVGVGRLLFGVQETKQLLLEGRSFLALGMILALQPVVDALFMARLAPEEAIGWYAAARKLVGVLTIPAGAIISALYPTLCRLWVENQDEYRKTARSAFRVCITLVMPLAIGCAVYNEIGVRIFNRQTFAPAEDNLRVLSGFVLLVYLTMVMGTCITAAGRQRAWASWQFLCVVVSAVADPFLIPYFQKHHGNGGLAVSYTTVASEILMFAGGVWMSPRGIFDRTVVRSALQVCVAGGVMVGVARLLWGLTPFVAAPIAIAAYSAALFAIGGIDKEQLRMLKSVLKKKG
jgi:O-antigen/teichoic acid export membrane protein